MTTARGNRSRRRGNGISTDDGLAWTAAIANSRDDGVFAGYDPRTGEKKREFAPDVQLHWFHHRCYPSKACGKFLITGRNGTEYVDLEKEHWTPNHWCCSLWPLDKPLPFPHRP